MKSTINLEETVGKTVGRARVVNAVKVAPGQIDNARAWHRAFGGSGIPKGVYRFKTFQEADTWMWKMMTSRGRRES